MTTPQTAVHTDIGEGRSKGKISRLAKMRKPQCTVVHEDFRIKRNAEITFLSHPRSEFERILQRSSLIENKPLRSRIRILKEISGTLELNGYSGIVLQKSRFGIAVCNYQ